MVNNNRKIQLSQVQFDDFHKNSARIIRTAVFGLDENEKVRDVFALPQNGLIITSIDIQSVGARVIIHFYAHFIFT